MGRYELEEDGDDDDYDEDQDHVNVNVNVVLGCNENNMFPLTDVLSRTMTVPNINNSNDALYNNCLNEYLPHAVVHSAKPIHYHIYYNSDEETAAYSYRSCGCGATWFWFSLMAVLSHIIYWYGPSVPPPEVSSTWTEFGNEQTFLLKKILTTWVQVGHYVSFWCWQAWKEQHYYSSYWQSTTTITQPPEESSLCRLSPDPWKTTTAPKNPFMLLGQDVVQKRLQSSLQSWKKHSQHTPLILYATGGQAVGKQSLAKLLLQKAFVDCGNTDLLLHIRSNSHKNFMEADLFSKLHNHVLDHPHGSIVLLSHVDEWPPGTLSKLLARIIHTGDVFANCIFIVTSHLGQIVIARTLRKYGGTPEHVPLLELELVLKHKLETHHHNLPPIVDEGEEEDSSPSSSFVNKEETSSKSFSFIHNPALVVLPFFPLDRPSMRLLLRYELKRNYHFQVHPQALESILHSLEWQTWIQKSTGEALFTFSPTGAMAVITVLDRIPLECSLPLVNVNHKDDNDNRDGDDSFKLNLVQEGRFQVLSCPSHVNLDGKKEECKQLCHFVM